MASLQELQSTLIKADAAGDVESARTLTREIDRLSGGLPVTPVTPGAVEEPQEEKSFFGGLKEQVTGAERRVPETEEEREKRPDRRV